MDQDFTVDEMLDDVGLFLPGAVWAAPATETGSAEGGLFWASDSVGGDLAGRAGRAVSKGPAGRPTAGRDELGLSARAGQEVQEMS
jgi:hypothetical protein